MFYYKESTLVLGFYSGFTKGEYHVIHVDFIVALRRTRGQRRWTLRESLSSILWTLTPHPGGIRCGGALLLPRACTNLGSLYPVLSFIPSSEFGFAFCVRAMIVRVSVGLLGYGRTFFIIGG